MTLSDDNMQALVTESKGSIVKLLGAFMNGRGSWETFPEGDNEAWLELAKTYLAALAGQVQERINQITVTTPEDFG